jgi:hypothetical protein
VITVAQARKLAKTDLKLGRETAEQVLVNLEEEFGKDSAVARAYRAVLER